MVFFSLTAARNDGIEWRRIAASAFSLSGAADIPADFRLTQQHVFKGFGSGGKYFAAAEPGAIRLPEPSYAITVFDLMRPREAAGGAGRW